MPPKAGKGRGRKQRSETKDKKRKYEQEKHDLEVVTETQRRRKVVKTKRNVSPSTSKMSDESEECPKSPKRSENSSQQSQEPRKLSPSPSPPRSKSPKSSDGEDNSRPQEEKEKEVDGNQKFLSEQTQPYNFSEAQEEALAEWVKDNKLLYDMKDKQYKDKALRRHLWERKAVEYGVDCETMLKWYSTQRTRYSKLKEGQQIRKTQKRSGDGLSSDDETEPFISIEISETDSDRDRFIRRIFGFLKPHIRRHKKDTPATFKDKLALAQTGELAGSDDGSLVEEPKLPTKKYTGCPTPRQSSSSRSKSSTETRTVTPYTGNRVSSDIQDKLVQFITRDNSESRSSPFCKYLENELDRLHDACLEPAYDEITTVLNHYRKVSRQFKMREATGNQVSPLEDVPSAFNSQLPHQQRPVPLVPASTVNIPRVSQLQQEGALASGTNLSSVRSTPSPLPEFIQSGPRQWNINQPQSSVWRPPGLWICRTESAIQLGTDPTTAVSYTSAYSGILRDLIPCDCTKYHDLIANKLFEDEYLESIFS